MTIPDGYQAVSIDASRAVEALDVAAFAFAFSVLQRDAEEFSTILPRGRARALEIVDPSRGAVGALAAVHASFAYPTRVPGGGAVAAAGLTWVGVHPGHRRRGLLRAMIDDHFARSLARGEAISTLWASEPAIYQRFGYGLAAPHLGLELSRGVDLRAVDGADSLTVEVDSADRERHTPLILSIQAQMERPGTILDFAEDMARDLFLDLDTKRITAGAEERRIVVIRDGDNPVAYALLRRKGDWTPSGPSGTVEVGAWAALTLAAEHRLFSVLADFDLMGTTRVDKVALDAPIVHLLKDIRGAKATLGDNLWLRVLSVPAALEARGYAAPCDVAIAITDTQLPDNNATWRLRAADGAVSVERTEADADVSMGIQELGTVYLGGPTVLDLLRAGRVTEHRAGAVRELSTAMASDLQPVANLNY
ncbi:GNAT family N-acetyltransferase [uncultured Demequina sp.]|uniref:GNAT family N-acetyltransferase n=1 Tax=uncultured Demequina sp. TaxID=693499 RepID=UPI0025D20C87|nr:GNAT family N-acetyltransferase [uncultured Demequina sp.]